VIDTGNMVCDSDWQYGDNFSELLSLSLGKSNISDCDKIFRLCHGSGR
jgi:hypothetical protein